MSTRKNNTYLQAEIESLRQRLSETEETLNAIRNGEVDAIVVSGKNGDKIFSLSSSETPYRIILEEMEEGALTVSSEGIILYSNQRFSSIMGVSLEKIIGSDMRSYIAEEDREEFKLLLNTGIRKAARKTLRFPGMENVLFLQLSVVPLPKSLEGEICIVVSDVTGITNYQNYLQEMVEERTEELNQANQKLQAEIKKLRETEEERKIAEANLIESEKRSREQELLFRSAFDEGSVPMTITSTDGTFLKVNNSFCFLTGYSKEELTGMSVFQITHTDDVESSIRGRGELSRGDRTSYRQEKRYIRKDGRSVWVSISTAPVPDGSGNPEFFVTHVQDINKRKNAELRLKESKERFKQLANSIPQLAWIARSDGYILWFNQRWYEYTGTTPEQMVGWGWRSVHNPDILPEVLNLYKESINTGMPFEMVFPLKSADGEFRDFLTKSIPIKDKKGNVEQWFGTNTDISDLKKVENELKLSKEKLSIALENGQTGTWQWDAESNIIELDDRTSRMLGISDGQFRGTFETILNYIHEEDLQHLKKAVQNALQAGDEIETIFRTRPVNGASNHISLKAHITRDKSNKPVSISGVFFDVTSMKEGAEQALIRLNEELLRSNTDLQQFAYVASHDLQEPLRMISSFTQLLQQRYGDKLDDDAKEYIRFAVEGSKRMYDLINGLLTYSRVQTRGREFSMVDMNNVVAKVKDNLNLVIEEKKASIVSRILPVVLADENQMIQLVQNLIENSLKFRQGHPQIAISSEVEDGFHVFSFRDNGIGIHEQYFERIFKIFQRLHRAEEYEGTGIGLAICKRIIERHGGRIWVNAEPGIGSDFRFSLPVYPVKSPNLS
ncbi:MAG TPA: PAS domain S-box protein [Bacteroidales bacterium]|nr:PAS domain S-box protein [Bacteroidales bacterium]